MATNTIDKFGRSGRTAANMRVEKYHRRPQAVGFKLTIDKNFDIQGKRMTNVGSPVEDSDCTTRKYVDKCIDKLVGDFTSTINSMQKLIETFKEENQASYEKSTEQVKKAIDDINARVTQSANTFRMVEARQDQAQSAVVDIERSKYVWTRAVKNKTASEVAKAMRGILNDANYAPRNCQSDQGLEFYNKSFKALMDQYGINHYSTYSTKKAAIVERVIKTIKNWLYKEFSSRGRYEWLSILPTITDQYNRRIHSTTKMRPIDVRPDTLIDAYNNPKIAPKKFKFKVGDVVRVSKYKGVFSRGFTPNWSNELFKIAKANITNPATYLLEDMEAKPILGCFYEYELQKTKYPDVYLIEKILRRSGNRVYVRWLGLPDSHNSWVNKADIIKT
ncbi:hypothetical protein NQ315_012224 [Exocentrus adspersus]|uniref:Chromo domain-containing protein n=1 Tax=Exocentrus adspersus TaxID=1586481 RepID=A0AAV8VAJ3_9CUCU|nr:hypothetical protein NQ315_012224 [Exocentrus adspersus]